MTRAVTVAAVAAAVLAGSTGASASQVALAPPAGTDWSANATTFRGKNGSQFTYLCPADAKPTSAYGTDVYTDDSSVCTAALHMGRITLAEGGTVTIEIRPGLSSYPGSTRNGVTSSSWQSWSGSFTVVGARAGGDAAGVKMGGAGWGTTATTHRGHNGSRYSYLCPPGGTFSNVWGTNTYTDDSSVCTAAVHVGEITVAQGGNVTIEVRPGQKTYASFAHNGVTTRSFGSWSGSFVFAGAAPIPGTGGGGGGSPPPTTTTGSSAPATGTATGTVLVNGRPFTDGAIRYQSTVDVTDGRLLLKTDTGSVTVFGAGVSAKFVLLRGTDSKKSIVELRLKGGDFSACGKRKTSSVSRAEATTTVRQLWGNGKGRFRTRGRYASATVRGTVWLTADRCDGTLTRVTRGVIQVSDLPQRKQITVRAGKSYLAKP